MSQELIEMERKLAELEAEEKAYNELESSKDKALARGISVYLSITPEEVAAGLIDPIQLGELLNQRWHKARIHIIDEFHNWNREDNDDE